MSYTREYTELKIRKEYERKHIEQKELNFCLHTTDEKVLLALEKMRKNKNSDLELKEIL